MKISRRLVSMYLAVILGSVIGLTFPSTPALANNWGSVCDNAIDCVSLANNSDHAIRFVNLSNAAVGSATYPNDIPRMQVAANWAIGQYNGTDMVVYRNESDSVPDVWLHDWNYGDTGWVGITRCPSDNSGTGGSHPNRWCRGQQNIYNSYYYWHATGYFDTDYDRRVVTCHEMGHTVGLRHNTLSTNSCMWTYVANATGSILTQHDIDHINARY